MPVVKVLGIGGAGSNGVSRMFSGDYLVSSITL